MEVDHPEDIVTLKDIHPSKAEEESTSHTQGNLFLAKTNPGIKLRGPRTTPHLHHITTTTNDSVVTNNTNYVFTTTSYSESYNSTTSTKLHRIEDQRREWSLRDPEGWHLTRWTPDRFSPILERYNKSPMAIISSIRRIQDTMDEDTDSMDVNANEDEHRGTDGSRPGSQQLPQIRNHRAVTDAERRLSVQLFYDSRTEQETPNPGLQTHQHLRAVFAFQNGGCTSITGYHQERRLSLQNRSERCVCGCPDTPTIPSIPLISSPRSDLPIQDTRVRVECGTTSVVKTDALCNRTVEETRYSHGILFGRPLCSSEDERGDEDKHPNDSRPLAEARISHQLGKEPAGPEVYTGILGLQIPDAINDDQGTEGEDEKPGSQTPPASDFHFTEIMQVDSQSYRENDCDDPRNRGCTFAHSLPTTRSCEVLGDQSPSMGKTMHVNSEEPGGRVLVAQVCTREERIGYSETHNETTICDDICGCIGHRLGSKLNDGQHPRILDKNRKRSFHQCTGIEDDSVCTATPQRKVPKLCNQDSLRQHDGAEIRQEIRRNSIDKATGAGNRNPGSLQQLSTRIGLPPYSRDTEHISGQAQSQEPDPSVRESVTLQMVQQDPKTMGSIEDRRVRWATQPPPKTFLESVSRPRGESSGRLQADLAEEGYLLEPALEVHSKGPTQTANRQSERGSSSDPAVAHSVLVATDHHVDEGASNSDEIDKSLDSSRLAVISQARTEAFITYLRNSHLFVTH